MKILNFTNATTWTNIWYVVKWRRNKKSFKIVIYLHLWCIINCYWVISRNWKICQRRHLPCRRDSISARTVLVWLPTRLIYKPGPCAPFSVNDFKSFVAQGKCRRAPSRVNNFPPDNSRRKFSTRRVCEASVQWAFDRRAISRWKREEIEVAVRGLFIYRTNGPPCESACVSVFAVR